MDRQKIIKGLKALEQQIIGLLEKVDDTRDRLFRLAEREFQDQKDVKDLIYTLHKDVLQLQEVYQQMIYKTVLLAETDANK